MQFIVFKSYKLIKQTYDMVLSQIVPMLYLSKNAFVTPQEVFALLTIVSSNGFRIQKLKQLVILYLTNNDFPTITLCKNKLVLLIKDMGRIYEIKC